MKKALRAKVSFRRILLRSVGRLELDIEDDRVLWLEAARGFASSEAVEALTLLAMLQVVDYNLWQAEVIATWTNDSSTRGKILERLSVLRHRPPQLGLSITIGQDDQQNHITNLTDHVLPYQSPSSDYKSDFCEFDQAIADTRADLGQLDLRTPVRISFRWSYDYAPSAKIISIYTIASLQGDTMINLSTQMERMMSHTRLRLHEVDMQTQIGLKVLTYLKNIASLGVQVTQLPQIEYSDGGTSYRSKQLTFQGVQGLLFQNGRHHGVKKVVVNARSREQLIMATLSALRFSDSTTSLHVRMFDIRTDDTSSYESVQNRRLWQWIAYAVFVDGAKHAVDSLEVERTLGETECKTIRAVLAASNPLALVLGGDPHSEPLGQIEATRFCFEPAIGTAASVWTSSTPVFADVIERPVTEATTANPATWKVLLPGYGCAWVASADIHRHIPASELPKAHKVSNFEFTSSRRQFRSMKSVLEIIGAPLKTIRSLYTNDHREPQAPYWFTRAFDACPQLEQFIMDSDDATFYSDLCLPAIVAAAAAGKCRLRRLEIMCVMNSDPANVIGFFQTLCDAKHPLTRQLTQLRITLRAMQFSDEVIIDPMLEMLAQNSVLTRFDMNFGVRDDSATELKDLFNKKTSYYIEHPRMKVAEALHLPAKLAFLSVVKRNDHRALGGLDSSLAALVFKFAGRWFTRTVGMDFTTYFLDPW